MSTVKQDLTQVGRLETILFVMNSRNFGQREAAEIVGGRSRLMRLCEEGKIRFEKLTAKQNGKWFCNAADVLKYATIHFKREKRYAKTNNKNSAA